MRRWNIQVEDNCQGLYPVYTLLCFTSSNSTLCIFQEKNTTTKCNQNWPAFKYSLPCGHTVGFSYVCLSLGRHGIACGAGVQRGGKGQDERVKCERIRRGRYPLPPELILTFLPFRLIRRLRVAYALARKLTFDSRHSVNNPLDCDQFSTISYLCFNGNMQTNNSPHLKASEVTVVTGSREL